MENKRSKKDYGGLGLLPLLIFLALYIGSGIFYAIQGTPKPFTVMIRYAPLLVGLLVGLIFFDREESIAQKAEIYFASAGRSGAMQLCLIILMAGGFAGAADAIGGKSSMANLAVALIPSNFVIPGIFILCAVMSICIGTSIGTLAAILPVAQAMCEGTGLSLGLAAAAAIGGAYFGDNLSMISDTTIGATQGVGAEMKDKFRMNFRIALPAALVAVVAFYFTGMGSAASSVAMEAGEYNLLTILPYFAVLVLAIIGMDVVLVLAIGMALTGVLGIATGTTFIAWINGISSGMEGMFWFVSFAIMISGVVGLVRYYGGLDWMVDKLTKPVKGEKSCEYILALIPMIVSALIANVTLGIIITVPIVKELGDRYKIAPKRMASLIDIGGCLGVTFVPHANAILMAQAQMGCEFNEIVPYSFYTFALAIATILTIQLGLLKGKDGKKDKKDAEAKG